MRYKEKGTSLMTSQWRSRRLTTFLAAVIDWVTLNLYDDLSQIKGITGVLKLQKRFRVWRTSFEPGINWLPFICSTDTGIHPHLALQYHARPSAVMVLWCCVWINSHICISKQKVTNNIHVFVSSPQMAITYLLPSGLTDKKAHPQMKVGRLKQNPLIPQ